jgi:hypothetical protein
MTTIELYINTETCDFKASGHCEHDICVSISALTSAFIQFAEEYGQKSAAFRVLVKSYERGAAEIHIDFGTVTVALDFMNGISGIITGFKLFAANFPDSVKYVDAKREKNEL